MLRAGLASCLLLAACSPSPGPGPGDLAPLPGPSDLALAVDGGAGPDLAARGPCVRRPREPDRLRRVVVSHPFTAQLGESGKDFELLELAVDGTLKRTGPHFAMGHATGAPIRFTPDGEIGLVAQSDGSLGVFRLGDGQPPEVLHAAFKGPFYADDVVPDPDGDRAYVLDGNTVENGGGVYRVDLGCDGRLTAGPRLLAGGSARAMALFAGPRRGLLAARELPGAPKDGELHVLDLTAAPKRLASARAFPDLKAIPSSVAVTADGRLGLLADNGLSAGNRIAVVDLIGLAPVAVISSPNPVQLVASPWGNAFLLLNSDGKDALRLLRYQPQSPKEPIVVVGEVAYQGGRPKLPAAAAVIDRGVLKGHLLVAENLAVRHLRFTDQGSVTDLALLDFGRGAPNIIGVLGVQP